MAKTIVQKVVFKNTTTKTLYDLYMNAKKHSKVTGAPAVITTKVGTKYSAHGSYITGENLHLIKDKLIVQTWRAQGWDPGDADSVFMIYLEQKGKNVELHAVHSNLPDKHSDHIAKGWFDHYWNQWKLYLAGKPIMRPNM